MPICTQNELKLYKNILILQKKNLLYFQILIGVLYKYFLKFFLNDFFYFWNYNCIISPLPFLPSNPPYTVWDSPLNAGNIIS